MEFLEHIINFIAKPTYYDDRGIPFRKDTGVEAKFTQLADDETPIDEIITSDGENIDYSPVASVKNNLFSRVKKTRGTITIKTIE